MNMKRIATISLSLMLSVALVALGTGIAFVQCCHTRTMELAQFADMEHHTEKDGEKCCGHHDNGHDNGTEISKPDCMETVIISPAQTFIPTKQHITLNTVYFLLPSSGGMTEAGAPNTATNTHPRHTADTPHSPPRDYLRLIRIMLI